MKTKHLIWAALAIGGAYLLYTQFSKPSAPAAAA
jgi:hypothetical protein